MHDLPLIIQAFPINLTATVNLSNSWKRNGTGWYEKYQGVKIFTSVTRSTVYARWDLTHARWDWTHMRWDLTYARSDWIEHWKTSKTHKISKFQFAEFSEFSYAQSHFTWVKYHLSSNYFFISHLILKIFGQNQYWNSTPHK